MPYMELFWSLTAGAIIGIGYFTYMRWTCDRAVRAARPMIWLMGGAAVRLAVTLPLLYVVMAGNWHRLLACLAGFILARWLLTAKHQDGVPATRISE